MISKKKMKALVDAIIFTGNELRHYFDAEDDLAQPAPPLSDEVMNIFEKRFSPKVPPSYLQLLSIYNGVKNFEWLDVSLLSAEYLLKHEDLDRSWVDAGAYKNGELFIFAQSNSDAHVVAFLPATVSKDGEMHVVHFDASGILTEHAGLEGYLRDRLQWFELSVAEEKADRAGLSIND